MDSTVKLLSITPAQYDKLELLTLTTAGKSYDLTPNAQIWPRSLNTAIGGSSTAIYLVVGDRGSQSGSGLDFTMGYTFLYVSISFRHDHDVLYPSPFSQRYYSIYDTTHGQVGLPTLPTRTRRPTKTYYSLRAIQPRFDILGVHAVCPAIVYRKLCYRDFYILMLMVYRGSDKPAVAKIRDSTRILC